MSKFTTVLISVLMLSFAACDKAEDKAEDKSDKSDKPEGKSDKSDKPEDKNDKPEEKAAEPAKEEPAADPGKVELELVDVPELGKLKLPKGAKETASQNWSYSLPDMNSISVSWEPHGVKNLKKAESTSELLGNAPTIKTSKTLENGTHMIERVRDSDGWTFVAVFAEDWYVKCSAPQEKMDICHEIVTSKQ